MQSKKMLIYFAMAPMFAYAQSSDNAVGKVANKDQTFGYTKMEMPSAKQQLSTQEQDVQTGFSFYNRGVHLIENQNQEGGTIQVNKLSKASIEMFQKSLPYLEKAHANDPARRNIAQALAGVYFALNKMDKYEKMQLLLKVDSE